MRRYLLIGTAAALLAIPALAAGRATTTITVSPNNTNRFGPGSVTTNVGAGAIHWAWGADPHGNNFAPHNVQQDNNLFSSGAPVKSKPAGYTITPSAGSFHYYCTLHGNPGSSLGMVGTIHIRPAVFNKTASSFGVTWSPGTNQTGNAFDVRYRVDGGAWKSWKNHVAATSAIFGAGNQHVAPGHTYEVQARSERRIAVSKASGWSPSVRVTT